MFFFLRKYKLRLQETHTKFSTFQQFSKLVGEIFKKNPPGGREATFFLKTVKEERSRAEDLAYLLICSF